MQHCGIDCEQAAAGATLPVNPISLSPAAESGTGQTEPLEVEWPVSQSWWTAADLSADLWIAFHGPA
jgi:hypothetical protein